MVDRCALKGYAHGCKAALIDAHGRVVATQTVYVTRAHGPTVCLCMALWDDGVDGVLCMGGLAGRSTPSSAPFKHIQ